MQNCDELRHTLDGVDKIYILICVTLFVCFFSWMPCQGGYCRKVIYRSKQAWHSYLDNHLTPSLSQLLQDLNCHCDIVEGSFFKSPCLFLNTEMLSYSLQCGLQRGYLSSYRFMLSFRDIYITLSSLGVPALVLGRQSCRDPSRSLFHLAPFLYSSPPPERNETVMIVTASKGTCCNSTKTKWALVGWVWPVSDLERPSTLIVRFSKSGTCGFSSFDAHTLDFINPIPQAHHRAFYSVTTEAASWVRKLPLKWIHCNTWTPALCHFIYCHLYTSSM